MSEEPNESRPRAKTQLVHGITWKDSLYREVTLWEMQDEEEKILGSKNPDMERIVRNCIVGLGKEKPTRAELELQIIPDIQIGDWNRIILDLRRLSLRDEYKYRSKCPGCNTVSGFVIDLSTIENIYARESVDELPYEMRNGKLAVFRPLTVRDQEALADIDKKRDDSLKRSLALRLVSVGDEKVETAPGDTWRKHVGRAVRLMKKHGLVSMGETDRIRTWLKEEEHTEVEDDDGDIIVIRKARDAKTDNILEDTCPEVDCGTTWRHYMEIDPAFLLPSSAE